MDNCGTILRLITKEVLETKYSLEDYNPHQWLWGERIKLVGSRIDFADLCSENVAVAFDPEDTSIQLGLDITDQQFVVIPASCILMRVKKR